MATASTGGGFPAKEVVFDDVGGRWLAVATGTAKCNNNDGERFDVVWLQPRPDGTMSGEWITTNSMACYSKRNATFTRTADVDVTSLPDPASQPPRVVSPAEALHGRYHDEINWADGDTQEADLSVRTDCLRTGERCMSFLANPDFAQALVFGNGKWTLNNEYDSPCPAGGTSHVKESAEYPLPQPPQDPITLLTGHGHRVVTGGTACAGGDYDEKFVRTGD